MASEWLPGVGLGAGPRTASRAVGVMASRVAVGLNSKASSELCGLAAALCAGEPLAFGEGSSRSLRGQRVVTVMGCRSGAGDTSWLSACEAPASSFGPVGLMPAQALWGRPGGTCSWVGVGSWGRPSCGDGVAEDAS